MYYLVSRRLSSHIKQLSVQPKNLDCQEASSSVFSPSSMVTMIYELALAKCCSVTVIYLLLLFSRSLQMIIINFIIFSIESFRGYFIYLLCQYKKKILEHLLIHIQGDSCDTMNHPV